MRVTMVVTAHRPRATARPADRVDFVDEDDRRRHLACFAEQLAHAAGADADDHLDELRGTRAEERHLRLTRRGAGQQRLASSWSPGQQDALRRARAEAAVLVRIFQGHQLLAAAA
jgi:hypothetical protein